MILETPSFVFTFATGQNANISFYDPSYFDFILE
jgi:hypothetical protein